MTRRKLLVSGAGIGGPALASILAARGWDVTVVERAAALRTGGQAVDFRGPVHREVLERLDLWAAIWAHRTPGNELVLLDRRGRPAVRIPAVMLSGDVEIVRGDLSRILVEQSLPAARYRFGDHLTALVEAGAGVQATFASGATETFDLVVGADGLHSGVRALWFGDEAGTVRHQGYRLATFSLPNTLGLAGQMWSYAVPGRSVTLSGNGALGRAQLVFAGPPIPRATHADPAAVRALLRDAYRGVGWETPRVLDALDGATDLYADDIATVRIARFTRGRVALLGDAAWGGTLGGQGTPLAIIGAYVLARELARAGDAADAGAIAAALGRYEARMRPYARACQKGAERVGPFHAPRTRFGLVARGLFYRAMTSRLLVRQFEKLVKSTATSFALPAPDSP